MRHLFPVDGEYEISVTLQRNRDDEYLGLERERKLDLRLDDQRLQLFTIAANPKKVVLGSGTPPDAHLKIRVPVKAGTRELAATFLKDTLVKEGIIDRVTGDDVQTYFEGVGSITVAGPFNVQGPGEHGYARQDFHLSSVRGRRASRRARKRSCPISPTAPIGVRSVTTTRRNCSRSTRRARGTAASSRA